MWKISLNLIEIVLGKLIRVHCNILSTFNTSLLCSCSCSVNELFIAISLRRQLKRNMSGAKQRTKLKQNLFIIKGVRELQIFKGAQCLAIGMNHSNIAQHRARVNQHMLNGNSTFVYFRENVQ